MRIAGTGGVVPLRREPRTSDTEAIEKLTGGQIGILSNVLVERFGVKRCGFVSIVELIRGYSGLSNWREIRGIRRFGVWLIALWRAFSGGLIARNKKKERKTHLEKNLPRVN